MRMPKDVNEAGVATARIAFGLQQPSDLVILGGYAYFPDHAGRVLRVAVMAQD
jgi:hypothetical protein